MQDEQERPSKADQYELRLQNIWKIASEIKKPVSYYFKER